MIDLVEEFLSNIDGRLLADAVAATAQPVLGGSTAPISQIGQKSPIGVKLALS